MVTVMLPAPHGQQTHSNADGFYIEATTPGALFVLEGDQTVAVYAPDKWASAVLGESDAEGVPAFC